jgi:hypothetical protein
LLQEKKKNSFWNLNFGSRVKNSVLLRPNQFLSIEQENMPAAGVDEFKLGNAPALGSAVAPLWGWDFRPCHFIMRDSISSPRKDAQSTILRAWEKFTRLEAWLYPTIVLATGMDDPNAGLSRGEFRASVRRLAPLWNWSPSATFRFMRLLEENGMISRVKHSGEHY